MPPRVAPQKGIMLKKEAKEITGGLSKPSKMPGPAYNLPAAACQTGAKLALVPGTVCHGCYALKGRYRFTNVKTALARRLEALGHPDWVKAMTVLIKGEKFFRWHDSGDLQSVAHLKAIFEVCNNTPETSHWLPTREARYLPLNHDSIPKNLTIRFSSHKIDQPPVKSWPWASTVYSHDAPIYGATSVSCPALKQGNSCGACRACWDRKISNVTYPKH